MKTTDLDDQMLLPICYNEIMEQLALENQEKLLYLYLMQHICCTN